MQGISRTTFAEGQERLEGVLRSRGLDPASLGDDLFGVTAVLDGNPGVRRALADPSRDGDAKAALVERLFAGKVGQPAIELLTGLVRGRWSSAMDLADAVESHAVNAVLAAAERGDRIDTVEDELFRFSRIVSGDQRLRDAFAARTPGADRKADLVRTLLGGKAEPETVRLAVHAATSPRGLRTERALERFVDAATQRRHQLLAHVVTAQPLSSGQRARLAAALQQQYGRPVRLALDLDPSIIGGVRVQVGGEVVDGTISTRLDEARRRLAG